MIELKERESQAPTTPNAAPARTPEPRSGGRGWVAAFIATVIAAAGVATGLALTRSDAPAPADRPHAGFHQPQIADGSRVDLSDQAFRYGLVDLVDGSKVDRSDQAFRYGMVVVVDGMKVGLSDQAFRDMYRAIHGAKAPVEAPRRSHDQLAFLLQHP